MSADSLLPSDQRSYHVSCRSPEDRVGSVIHVWVSVACVFPTGIPVTDRQHSYNRALRLPVRQGSIQVTLKYSPSLPLWADALNSLSICKHAFMRIHFWMQGVASPSPHAAASLCISILLHLSACICVYSSVCVCVSVLVCVCVTQLDSINRNGRMYACWCLPRQPWQPMSYLGRVHLVVLLLWFRGDIVCVALETFRISFTGLLFFP